MTRLPLWAGASLAVVIAGSSLPSAHAYLRIQLPRTLNAEMAPMTTDMRAPAPMPEPGTWSWSSGSQASRPAMPPRMDGMPPMPPEPLMGPPPEMRMMPAPTGVSPSSVGVMPIGTADDIPAPTGMPTPGRTDMPAPMWPPMHGAPADSASSVMTRTNGEDGRQCPAYPGNAAPEGCRFEWSEYDGCPVRTMTCDTQTVPASGDAVITLPMAPVAGYEDEVRVNAAPEAAQSRFSDVGTETEIGRAANALAERGVIGGYADGTFREDDPVNRAEAAKFLMLATGAGTAPEGSANPFWDVMEGEWYAPFVLQAAGRGVIGGYADGTFRPADQVGTDEFLKMATLAFGLETGLPYTYGDVPQNAWSAPYAGTAERYGLFPERAGDLDPARDLTRGEVAYAIERLLEQR